MPTTAVRIDPQIDRPAHRIAVAPTLAAAHSEILRIATSRSMPGIAIDPVPEAPSPRTIAAALAKVLASTTFRHSGPHRTFLRYVVEATIAGRARCLKEVVIGLDVFGRDLDRYDPRRDSIVRVEARRLRKKLSRYYDSEGAADTIEIRLDAGGYIPSFSLRSDAIGTGERRPLVVVLPLRVAGAGDLAATLAAGLADQLIDRLGSLSGLDVMAPLATGQARVRDAVPGTRNRGRGIDFVVDGSVIQAGAKLRCIVHVSSTRDGVRRWSRLFDFDPVDDAQRNHVDVFAFQDHIASAASAAVALEATRTT